MKILVVGGAGMIGGHAALRLSAAGYRVTIAGRTPPQPGTPLAALDFRRIDYLSENIDVGTLTGADALVFAAGNDVRHVPPDADTDAHWQRANAEGVPRFFAAARDAGVAIAINIGSFYPQAAPALIATNAYVRSRKAADDGIRALASGSFRAISLNASFVVGSVPGLTIPMFEAYTGYAQGAFARMPSFAPPGGTNFISTDSISDAVEGALARGENGQAYLIGDENLSFQAFFGAFFAAAGQPAPLVLDQEHPMLPDSVMLCGRGANLFFEPDAREVALLGYRRGDVVRTIGDIVRQYGGATGVPAEETA